MCLNTSKRATTLPLHPQVGPLCWATAWVLLPLLRDGGVGGSVAHKARFMCATLSRAAYYQTSSGWSGDPVIPSSQSRMQGPLSPGKFSFF